VNCIAKEITDSQRFSYEYVKTFLENKGFELLSETYINSNSKLKMKCSKGHIINVPYSKIRDRGTCSMCASSRGEIKISEVLKKYEIDFQKEKRFDDCRNIETNYRLPFDFYLPKYNTIIEFMGKQHYEHVGIKKFGDYNEFLKRQERDKFKKEYVINNNMIYIEIHYSELENKNIENFLIDRLKLKKEKD
jgi:hypothetical protein